MNELTSIANYSRDNLHFRTLLEINSASDLSVGSGIKKEPLEGSESVDLDDFDDFFSDKPRLSVKDRLDKLKHRGISVNQPGETKKPAAKKAPTEEFDDIEPVTILFKF
jgi:hypothetical protein